MKNQSSLLLILLLFSFDAVLVNFNEIEKELSPNDNSTPGNFRDGMDTSITINDRVHISNIEKE